MLLVFGLTRGATQNIVQSGRRYNPVLRGIWIGPSQSCHSCGFVQNIAHHEVHLTVFSARQTSWITTRKQAVLYLRCVHSRSSNIQRICRKPRVCTALQTTAIAFLVGSKSHLDVNIFSDSGLRCLGLAWRRKHNSFF